MGDKKQGGTLPGFSKQSMLELNDDKNEFVNSIQNDGGADGNNIEINFKVYNLNIRSGIY